MIFLRFQIRQARLGALRLSPHGHVLPIVRRRALLEEGERLRLLSCGDGRRCLFLRLGRERRRRGLGPHTSAAHDAAAPRRRAAAASFPVILAVQRLNHGHVPFSQRLNDFRRRVHAHVERLFEVQVDFVRISVGHF